MEPHGVTPELALRAYEALTYYAAWVFTALASVVMLAYAVFVCRECYLLSRSGTRKPAIEPASTRPTRRPSAEPLAFRVILRFFTREEEEGLVAFLKALSGSVQDEERQLMAWKSGKPSHD